jgi:hypothetical protein
MFVVVSLPNREPIDERSVMAQDRGMQGLTMGQVEGNLLADLRLHLTDGALRPFPSIVRLLLAVVLNPQNRKPVCLLMPDTRHVAELCAVIGSLQWLRDDFERSKAAFLAAGLPTGSYVRSTSDGLVYQLGDSDDLGVRLLFINKAMRATSGCRIITREETLGYELTLRCRPMAKPEDGKRRPCPTPLDALVGVRTFGNTSIIQNRMILLGAREEFERFLSSVRLSRDSVKNEGVKVLSDVFCWGAMTDTGFSVEQPSGAGGAPLVAVARDASLLRQAFSDTPCERFTTTIVTSQTSSVLNRLDDVDRVAQNQRFILFAEARRRAEVSRLASDGWHVWELQPWEMVAPDQAPAPLGLGGVDASRRAGSFEIHQRIRESTATCDEIERVFEGLNLVSRLLGAEEVDGDPTASECVIGCRDLFFDAAGWLSFPVGKEYDAAHLAIGDLSRKAAKLRMLAGQESVDVVQALADAALRFLDSGVPGLPTPKGEVLLRLAQEGKDSGKHGLAVVTAHPRSSEEARSFLQRHDHDLPCSSAADIANGHPPQGIILLNAVWRQKFDALVDPWPTRSVVLCGYRCEVQRYQRWLTLRESARERLWPSEDERAAMTGLPAANLPRRPTSGNTTNATGTAPIDDSEDGFEKVVKPKPNNWSRRPPLPVSQNDETSKAFFCRFVGTSWTAFSEDHQVTKLSAGPGGRQHVPVIEVSELCPGDRVVMREHGQKDAIRQLAEAEIGQDKYTALKDRARHWRRTLEATGLPARDIADRLAVFGVRRNISTIQSWLKYSEMIGPKSKEDLLAICDAFAPAKEDAAKWEACWDAICELRSLHISAGNTLSGLISRQCGGLLLEPSEKETKVRLPAGDAWVLEVAHIDSAASDWPSHIVNHLQWEETQVDVSRLALSDLGLSEVGI